MTTDTMLTGSTSAQENADLLREGYAAFGRGDLAAVERTFDPGIVWQVQRLGQLSGDHRGWPAVAQFFGRSMELTQGTFRIEVLEVLANEAGAAAVVQSKARRNGLELDDRQIHHFHVRDGRVVEVWQYVGNGQAAADFWA